jgi:hypothetical protein
MKLIVRLKAFEDLSQRNKVTTNKRDYYQMNKGKRGRILLPKRRKLYSKITIKLTKIPKEQIIYCLVLTCDFHISIANNGTKVRLNKLVMR